MTTTSNMPVDPSNTVAKELAGFMVDFTMALVGSANGVQRQIGVDSQTTINFGILEQMLNQEYYSSQPNDPAGHAAGNGDNPTVYKANWNMQDWINQMMADAADSSNPAANAWISGDQAAFNKLSSQASGVTSFADSLVNSSNTMSTTDANNFSQIMQMAQTINLIGFVASLLAKG